MDGGSQLTAKALNAALSICRGEPGARSSRRARVLLLPAAGWSYRRTMEAMFCGSDLVASV